MKLKNVLIIIILSTACVNKEANDAKNLQLLQSRIDKYAKDFNISDNAKKTMFKYHLNTLNNVEWISLFSFPLNEFPPEIKNFKHLKKIAFTNINLSSFGDYHSDSIIYLYLWGCRFHQQTSKLKERFPNLKEISLGNNDLNEIIVVDNLPDKLEKLDIASNPKVILKMNDSNKVKKMCLEHIIYDKNTIIDTNLFKLKSINFVKLKNLKIGEE